MAAKASFVLLVLIAAVATKAWAGTNGLKENLGGGEAELTATEDIPVLKPSSCGPGSPVGDCVDEDEEAAMESESLRRILKTRRKYISYGALDRDRIPCDHKGSSYYNCTQHGRANPYHRDCDVITRCQRDIS